MLSINIVAVSILLLLQLTEGATWAIDDSDNVVITNENHHSVEPGKITSPVTRKTLLPHRPRQLQVFGGEIDKRCEQLMDNTLEGIFAPKDCNCNQAGILPTLVIDCERIQESCIIQRRFTDAPDDTLFCGSPGIRITVDVWSIIFGGLPVVAELCFYDVSVFNVTVPDIINPVCFGIYAGLPGSVPLANLLGLIFGRTASTAKLLQDSSASTSVVKRRQKPKSINEKSCVPNFGDNKEPCNSCTICPPEDGGGIIFDCSNIVPGFRSTECIVLPSYV